MQRLSLYQDLKVNPTLRFPYSVSAKLENDVITVSYDESSIESTALAGTTRSLINNMVIGVSEGFQKTLILGGSWIQS